MAAKILIVEDEPGLLEGLQHNFQFEGYEIVTAANGKDGLRAALKDKPDLIVLDLMLPEKSGFDVLKDFRERNAATPVLILTARNFEADIVKGFDLGADDYVTKPFSVAELLARVRALLKRAPAADADHVRRARQVELAAAKVRADTAHDLGDGERLRHVVVGAGVEPLHAVRLGVERGEHEDRHVVLLGAQPCADLDAGHARQEEVEDHQVVAPRPSLLERIAAVSHSVDLVPGLAQRVRHGFADRRLVLDDEDPAVHPTRVAEGNLTVKDVPAPTTDDTSMSPPIACTA